MNRILPILITALILAAGALSADVGEGELARLREAFMSRILSDNPGQEESIRRCLGSMVKEGNAGSRLIDRFGLFLHDSSRNGLELARIRFIKDQGTAVFFIVLKDTSDGQLYSLYLEYILTGGSTIKLKDTYFSMVYSERIKSVTKFFGGKE